jgi:hypothetical protein
MPNMMPSMMPNIMSIATANIDELRNGSDTREGIYGITPSIMKSMEKCNGYLVV